MVSTSCTTELAQGNADGDGAVRTPGSRHPVAVPTQGPQARSNVGGRGLHGLRPLMVFVDGAAGRGGPRPDLLCAWALTCEGRRELLALEAGDKDAPDHAWTFLADLKRRGLADPLLVVTDGESPLLRASEMCFPTSLVQRCLAHHLRALSYRVPVGVEAQVLNAVRAACEAPSPSLAATLKRDVVKRHGASLPALVGYFERTFDSCTSHLHLPRSLHRVARATLVSECLLAAERRLEGGVPAVGEAVAGMRVALAAVLAEGRDIVVGEAEAREIEALAARLSGAARRAG